MPEIQAILPWLQAHPLQALALALCLVVLWMANITLTPEQAAASPQWASAVILAQRVAPVLRGILKPLAGVFLPKIAVEVVASMFPAKDATASNAPPSDGGAGGAP
jgi:hypothetical protein